MRFRPPLMPGGGALALLLPTWALAQPDQAPVAALWQTLLPQLLCAMLALMGLILALLSRIHARERHLVFLAALMGLWVLRSALDWIALPQLGGDRRLLLSTALLPWLSLCLIQFLLRPTGGQRPWLDLVLPLQAVLVPLSLLLLPAQMAMLSQAWSALLVLQVLAAMAWHLRERRDQGLKTTVLLGLGAIALLLELVTPWRPATIVLPLLLLALGLRIILNIAHARVNAEHLQLEHEQHAQAKVADIERSFSEMAEQKLEQVTERERKRIAADLHDDLGAKLLTIVHTSESDRISTLAREALEEMRLSVRGLTGKPVQLLDALGDWRAEVVSRLGQANILAEWKAPAEEVIHTLQARAYVQTTRIFREAVSNIIKHSGATHCVVSCTVLDGDFLVVIQDNGQGITTELDGRLDKGHGMASMKSRAKQMHGQCLVESGPGWGTVIRLTIPL
ncbi:sensor histidine kinase [Paucibacter sp. XJ19-41]|uniref:sensor histidine kinase n=1 Tax=Paucibacter sp. XJ19-41 TaxID=2927824 RepID=UPI00234A0C1C|nr:ATP-binding protein [Paucibacter sp. XJ19-41]MDC6167960.1 ATP-binding protein [Paucibacter sp. XJ19-41]